MRKFLYITGALLGIGFLILAISAWKKNKDLTSPYNDMPGTTGTPAVNTTKHPTDTGHTTAPVRPVKNDSIVASKDKAWLYDHNEIPTRQAKKGEFLGTVIEVEEWHTGPMVKYFHGTEIGYVDLANVKVSK